jgi:hypothetical protein
MSKIRIKPTRINYHRNTRDAGYVFSRELVNAVCQYTTRSRQDVETMVAIIGREMNKLILKGRPVGLPKSVVVYSIRLPGTRKNYKGEVVEKSARLRLKVPVKLLSLYKSKKRPVTGSFKDQHAKQLAIMTKALWLRPEEKHKPDEYKLPVYGEDFKPRRLA